MGLNVKAKMLSNSLEEAIKEKLWPFGYIKI